VTFADRPRPDTIERMSPARRHLDVTMRFWVVLMLAGFLAGCSGSTSPSPSPSLALTCGPLAANACATVVSIALGTLPAAHRPVDAVSVEATSASATCPPMAVGPAPGYRICDLLVTITKSDGEVVVPFVRGGDGWTLSRGVR
jgi:hypothetical protein